jgi:hypothetical protein
MAKKDLSIKPKGIIHIQDLQKLAALHTSMKEIANWFGVPVTTLENDPWHTLIQDARSTTKQRLKTKAIDRALNADSDTMLKFCLANYCGFSDNPNANTIKSDIEPMSEEQITSELSDIIKKYGGSVKISD